MVIMQEFVGADVEGHWVFRIKGRPAGKPDDRNKAAATKEWTKLEACVVCAMTNLYPQEFSSKQDRDDWLGYARRAIDEVKEYFVRELKKRG